MEPSVTYPCRCGGAPAPHTHTVPAHVAHERGVHTSSGPRVEATTVGSPATDGEETGLARDIADAVAGALLGMHIGDAFAAPLHWYYSHAVALRHLQVHYGGRLGGYRQLAAGAVEEGHPDR
jgi:hypothetical protein